MSYIVFLLSLLLLGAGAFSAYLSLDLLPTGPGLLYAFSGAVAAVGAVLVLAIGLLIRRVDRLGRLVQASTVVAASEARLPPHTAPADAPAAETVPLDAEAEMPAGPLAELTPGEMQPLGAEGTETEGVDEDAVNENRAGHLPTLAAIERAIETPEAPPALIGRYSSGGANYMIFADGSIEAETTDGTFKFPSMGDFKQYLAERREAKG